MSVTTLNKTFTKIDGTNFNLKEDRTVEENINAIDRLQYLATTASGLKKMIAETVNLKNTFKQQVEYYNFWVDMLNEAIEECGLEIDNPKKVELPDDFHLDDLELVDKIPSVSIENKSE